ANEGDLASEEYPVSRISPSSFTAWLSSLQEVPRAKSCRGLLRWPFATETRDKPNLAGPLDTSIPHMVLSTATCPSLCELARGPGERSDSIERQPSYRAHRRS